MPGFPSYRGAHGKQGINSCHTYDCSYLWCIKTGNSGWSWFFFFFKGKSCNPTAATSYGLDLKANIRQLSRLPPHSRRIRGHLCSFPITWPSPPPPSPIWGRNIPPYLGNHWFLHGSNKNSTPFQGFLGKSSRHKRPIGVHFPGKKIWKRACGLYANQTGGGGEIHHLKLKKKIASNKSNVRSHYSLKIKRRKIASIPAIMTNGAVDCFLQGEEVGACQFFNCCLVDSCFKQIPASECLSIFFLHTPPINVVILQYLERFSATLNTPDTLGLSNDLKFANTWRFCEGSCRLKPDENIITIRRPGEW